VRSQNPDSSRRAAAGFAASAAVPAPPASATPPASAASPSSATPAARGGAPGPIRTARPASRPDPAPSRPAVGAAERELGLTLHRLRLENGLSLRALARRLGYSAHSMFSDIEKGRKIPAEPLIRSYEQCFDLPAGSLRALRRKALAERARRMTDPLASAADQPGGAPGPDHRPAVGELVALLAGALLSRTRRVFGGWTP
jgi:transcriptional regulator with XRE-family HTH domain